MSARVSSTIAEPSPVEKPAGFSASCRDDEGLVSCVPGGCGARRYQAMAAIFSNRDGYGQGAWTSIRPISAIWPFSSKANNSSSTSSNCSSVGHGEKHSCAAICRDAIRSAVGHGAPLLDRASP